MTGRELVVRYQVEDMRLREEDNRLKLKRGEGSLSLLEEEDNMSGMLNKLLIKKVLSSANFEEEGSVEGYRVEGRATSLIREEKREQLEALTQAC